MRDLYEVLGVEKAASPADLKKAYRRLAQQFHPDKNPDDKAAEESFKEAANAYQILSDDDQRAAYDRFGFDGLRRGGGGGGQGAGFSNVEDIFSAFGDLFGDFFGGRSSGGRGQRRGQDLRVDLGITFPEAVWGTTKDVKVSRDVACTTCSGSGAKPGTKPEPCKTCQGKGQVVHAQGFFMVQTTCPACRGAGRTIKEPCDDCRGRGTKPESATLTVTVPAGVDDGQTLRLAGKGEVIANGQPGHLYVVLHVQADERFKRDGEDILSEVPISFIKAALGGDIEIDTLDDDCKGTATLDIKAGAQPNDVYVRRGQGIPRVGESSRGDHVVQLKVEIPKKLSGRQEELLRELATELGESGVKEKRGLFGRKK
jgi:molecular chaperone DnaJ|nr:molecular chaperone DnaJ [Kofleriaceae bacterium]